MLEHKLTSWPSHKKGVLVRFSDDRIGSQLMSMGVLPQCSIKVINKSPFGNTYIILVNEKQRIAVRKEEADKILVK